MLVTASKPSLFFHLDKQAIRSSEASENDNVATSTPLNTVNGRRILLKLKDITDQKRQRQICWLSRFVSCVCLVHPTLQQTGFLCILETFYVLILRLVVRWTRKTARTRKRDRRRSKMCGSFAQSVLRPIIQSSLHSTF